MQFLWFMQNRIHSFIYLSQHQFIIVCHVLTFFCYQKNFFLHKIIIAAIKIAKKTFCEKRIELEPLRAFSSFIYEEALS